MEQIDVPQSSEKIWKPIPVRRSWVIPNIVSELKAAGNNAERILWKAGIDPGTISDPYFRVRLDRVHLFFDLAAEALDDPTLGLKIGAQIQPGVRGLYGYILLNAPNLRTAIEDFIKYIRYFRGSLDLKLEASGGTATFSMTVRDPMLRCNRHHSDCFIVATLTFFRSLMGPDWSPLEAHLQHPEPKDGVAAYQDCFRCPVFFEKPVNAILFRADDLDYEPSDADRVLYEYLKAAADRSLEYLPERDGLVTRLRDMIVPSLHHGGLGIEEAAKGLGLSTRSLQRALADHGTSFRQVTDSARREMAAELLDRSDLSLIEIALLTGYSDSSAFNHAFRRWTGRTPLAYRRESA